VAGRADWHVQLSAATATLRPPRPDILTAATAFVDSYLDALRTLSPEEVGRTPCLGYGRGGVAYTLLKAGTLRAHRALVQGARRWAAAGLRSGRTYQLRGWPKASFGRGLTGLHAIAALAAHEAGDVAVCRRDLRRFIDSSRRARGRLDLLQGMAGRLAGAAIVMRRIPDPGVRALGDELADRILAALAARADPLRPRGLAHGWAGVALAALSWQAAVGTLPRRALRDAVLAARREGPEPMWTDWAHGAAGMALLFARAYVQLGDRRFLAWAREEAARAHAERRRGFSILDGAPGVAYCMLGVAAADPAGPWRDAAWEIAARILSYIDIPDFYPYGAWSGLGGVCCLALDLIHETEAGFPGVEA
jgi:hypothetical protein